MTWFIAHKPESGDVVLHPSTAVYPDYPAAAEVARARVTAASPKELKLMILRVHDIVEVAAPPVAIRSPHETIGEGAFTRPSAQLKDM